MFFSRNNQQQHGREGSNLLTIGTTNITDSHLNQVTNVEHLDNMNVENLQQNIQQDVHIQQTLHQYFRTEMTINANQSKFDFHPFR